MLYAPLSGAFLYYQTHTFHLFAVLRTRRDYINSCGIDAAVAENIGELCYIPFYCIGNTGEQMAQVMRKHLLRIYVCLLAKGFHFTPDICAAYRFACACYKNRTAVNFLLRCIAEQFLFQVFYDKNGSCFPFAVDNGFAAPYRLDRYIRQFADADTRAAYRLQNQIKPLVMISFGGSAKPSVFRLCQLLFLGTENCCCSFSVLTFKSYLFKNSNRQFMLASIEFTLRTA